MDARQYVQLFVDEAAELAEKMSASLRTLQGGHNEPAVREFFRAAHSIKGMAASMGYDGMRDAMHRLEDVFHHLRESPRPLDERLMAAALLTVDALHASIEDIKASGEPVRGFSEALAALDAASGKAGTAAEAQPLELDAPPAPAAGAPAAVQPDIPVYAVTIKMDPADPLPAARAMVAYKSLESQAGGVLECSPTLQQVASGKFGGTLKIRLQTRKSRTELEAFIAGMTSVQDFSVAEERPAAPEPQAPQAAAGERPAAASSAAGASVRVPVETLDSFFNIAGEFIVHHGKLQAAARKAGSPPGLQQALDRARHLIDDFYEGVLRLRMMPFDWLAPRLERVLREAARSCGKDVTLEVEGGDVALDRSVLDELLEPLTHILRNAVDHGIEAAELRRERGKPKQGLIRIELRRHSDTVDITVRDDGGGMDPARIKAAAIARGYLDAERAAALDEAEALMLCTLPGFSTRTQVTDLSGRGVGMDVVRTKIETLGGHLWIQSEAGRGTAIGFRLPPTMSVLRAFVVEQDGEPYAVPLYQVHRTLLVRRADLQRVQDEYWFRWQDNSMPVHRFASLLARRGDTGAAELPEEFPCLVVRRGERFHALAVECVVGTQDVVVKPLHVPLEELRQFSGAAVFGDGRMALIVDTENLLAAPPRAGQQGAA